MAEQLDQAGTAGPGQGSWDGGLSVVPCISLPTLSSRPIYRIFFSLVVRPWDLWRRLSGPGHWRTGQRRRWRMQLLRRRACIGAASAGGRRQWNGLRPEWTCWRMQSTGLYGSESWRGMKRKYTQPVRGKGASLLNEETRGGATPGSSWDPPQPPRGGPCFLGSWTIWNRC